MSEREEPSSQDGSTIASFGVDASVRDSHHAEGAAVASEGVEARAPQRPRPAPRPSSPGEPRASLVPGNGPGRTSNVGTQQGLPAVLPPVAAQLDLARVSMPPERQSFSHGARDADSAVQTWPEDHRSAHNFAPIGAVAAPEFDDAQSPFSGAPKPFPAPPEFPPFPRALCGAGLLAELRVENLSSLPRLSDEPTPRERLDFLDAYYAAGTDPVVSLRRRATDRWFVYDAAQPLAGPQLVQRLTFVLPELAHALLERVGGKQGTLLLRAGDHVCALDDDHSVRGNPSIGVHELVRGMNMLMERRGERVRLVGLVGDGTREAYVGVGSLTLAMALANRELLTARDSETLTHLTGW